MISHLLNFLHFQGIIQVKLINYVLKIRLSFPREPWNLSDSRNLRKLQQPLNLTEYKYKVREKGERRKMWIDNQQKRPLLDCTTVREHHRSQVACV